MTNEQILELIGAKPGIRTVQISDRLDCDIGELQEALQGLMTSGTIFSKPVIGPNNHKATAYWIAGAAGQTETSAPVPAEPKNSGTAMPGKTKVEQAIEFIAARGEEGSATSSELHALLKLKPHEYASSYLAPPLNDGRLVKDGKTWTLGDGTPRIPRGTATAKPVFEAPALSATPAAPEPANAAVPAALATVETAVPPAPASVEPIAGPEKSVPQPAVVPGNAGPGFSCALWSHGELQLVRGGAELVKLTVEETKHLCEYLDRLGESAEVMP